MQSWLESFSETAIRRSADTAHDLKTPLNIAVLNLELLRMRMRKLTEVEDEKIVAYAHTVELELRRIGIILDAYFGMIQPPSAEPPEAIAIDVAMSAEASRHDLRLPPAETAMLVRIHEGRIRELAGLFFKGVCASLERDSLSFRWRIGTGGCVLEIEGVPSEPLETEKIFKLYNTDEHGNPRLSLAVARLIAETYGGTLEAEADENRAEGRVALRLTLPTG